MTHRIKGLHSRNWSPACTASLVSPCSPDHDAARLVARDHVAHAAPDARCRNRGHRLVVRHYLLSWFALDSITIFAPLSFDLYLRPRETLKLTQASVVRPKAGTEYKKWGCHRGPQRAGGLAAREKPRVRRDGLHVPGRLRPRGGIVKTRYRVLREWEGRPSDLISLDVSI